MAKSDHGAAETAAATAPEQATAPGETKAAVTQEIRGRLGPAEDYEHAAELFQVLSDPTRLRLIAALATSPLCVGELSAVVGLGQSATSHALRILRDRGIAVAQRAGQQVRYELANGQIRGLLASAWRQALETEPPVALAAPTGASGDTAEERGEDGEEHEKHKKKKKKKKKKKHRGD